MKDGPTYFKGSVGWTREAITLVICRVIKCLTKLTYGFVLVQGLRARSITAENGSRRVRQLRPQSGSSER